MGLIGAEIGGAPHEGRLLHHARRIALAGDLGIDGLVLAHALMDRGVRAEIRPLPPDDLEISRGLHRIPFALGDDADEVALADDLGPRDMGDGGFIHRQGLRADAKAPLSARQHHAAMQHAGHAQVLHMRIFARRLLGDIDARRALTHKAILARGLERRDARVFHIEGLVTEEFPIGDGAEIVLALHRDHAISHHEAARLHAQLHRRAGQKLLPRLRRRRPQRRGAAMDRGAGAGGLLVGGDVGVEPDGAHLMHAEIKLFGGHLQKPGLVALTQLAFACVDRRRIVGVDGDPCIDRLIVGRTGLGAARCLRQRGRRQAEADDHGAAALQQAAPGEIGHAI